MTPDKIRAYHRALARAEKSARFAEVVTHRTWARAREAQIAAEDLSTSNAISDDSLRAQLKVQAATVRTKADATTDAAYTLGGYLSQLARLAGVRR